MDTSILITAAVGVVTSFFSGFLSWFFTRKKYNTEVESNQLNNLTKAFEFYKSITEDNNKKLEFYIKLGEHNRAQIHNLETMVDALAKMVCKDDTCKRRMPISDVEIKQLLSSLNKKNNEETK